MANITESKSLKSISYFSRNSGDRSIDRLETLDYPLVTRRK